MSRSHRIHWPPIVIRTSAFFIATLATNAMFGGIDDPKAAVTSVALTAMWFIASVVGAWGQRDSMLEAQR